MRLAHSVLLSLALVAPASAQETIPFQRQQGFYTTRDDSPSAPGSATLPWQNGGNASNTAPPSSDPNSPNYVPFQRATPYGSQAVPAPLPMIRAVPIENIDGIEVSEPAAPTPVAIEPGANPVEEDPAQPTELTAPLFAANPDTTTPREIVLRVLNKVTGRAEELKARPGETVPSGKIEITAVNCFTSMPNSQPDSVALLSIHEKVPELKQPKLLFHGWMYASSASLTALEHPVYDVTMVDCAMKTKPVDALDEDDKKKAEKSKKKAD